MIFLLFILYVMYDIFAWGLVTLTYWQWFILPVFPTLPVLTFLQACGLMMFISLFKNHNNPIIDNEYLDVSNTLIFGVLAPWIMLVAGFLLHALM